jgi:hypothetical protein
MAEEITPEPTERLEGVLAVGVTTPVSRMAADVPPEATRNDVMHVYPTTETMVVEHVTVEVTIDHLRGDVPTASEPTDSERYIAMADGATTELHSAILLNTDSITTETVADYAKTDYAPQQLLAQTTAPAEVEQLLADQAGPVDGQALSHQCLQPSHSITDDIRTARSQPVQFPNPQAERTREPADCDEDMSR